MKQAKKRQPSQQKPTQLEIKLDKMIRIMDELLKSDSHNTKRNAELVKQLRSV